MSKVKCRSSGRLRPAGQSIIEVVIAAGVFAVLAFGVLTLVVDPLMSQVNAGQRYRASLLASQGLEAAKTIKDRRWTDLANGIHGLTQDAQGNWMLSGASDVTDGLYTRVLTISPVYRDSSWFIVASGGTLDPRTLKVTSEVSWVSGILPVTRAVSRSEFFTDWNNYDWVQTTDADFGPGTKNGTMVSGTGTPAAVTLATRGRGWSGGGGQIIQQNCYADWAPGTTQNTVIALGCPSPGISETGANEWVQINAGSQFFQTTDLDFNTGSFTNTVVVDTGDLGAVTLDVANNWAKMTTPTSNHLNAVAMASSSFGFAVGNGGTILAWNGSAWTAASSPTSNALYGVTCVSATDCWAVGAGGAIIRWNGTAWSNATSPTNQGLNGVNCRLTNDCWAVGSSGKILRYAGTNWSEFTDTGNDNWASVVSVSATDAWTVGPSGKIYRWNGTSWSQFVDTGNQSWNSVSVISGTFGFVVGSGGAIYRWDGANWSTVSSPTGSDLRGIRLISTSDGFAVGASGAVIRWNGSAWSADTGVDTNQMNGVYQLSSQEAYAVGNNGSVWQYKAHYKSSGTYLSEVFDAGAAASWGHLFWTQTVPANTTLTLATRSGNTPTPDGTWSAWSPELTDPYNSLIASPGSRYIQYRLSAATTDKFYAPRLNSITVTYNEPAQATFRSTIRLIGGNDGWAVGGGGSIARYDGTNVTWSSWPSPTTNTLLGADFADQYDVWAVGIKGTIIFWNGSNWITQTSPTGRDLYGISVVSQSLAFASGQLGTLLIWNGATWQTMPSPTNQGLNAIDMVSSTDGWAVGNNGAIIHWNGTTWSEWPKFTSTSLEGISMVGSNFGMVVGGNGVAFKWDGASWTPVNSTTNNELKAVHCLAGDYCWAVGVEQTFIQWNGSVWSRYVFANPSNPLIQSVFMITRDDGWAVGEGGAFFHYTMKYASPAYYTSPVVDSGKAGAVWNALFWDSLEPQTTGLTMAVRTGATNTVDASWSGWSSELTDKGGSPIPSPPNRYVQYRATFTTGDTYHTATLQAVRLLYDNVTGQDLYGVQGTAYNDVWGVGRSGTVIHYDGFTWSASNSGTADTLRAVNTLASDNAFAVGDMGRIVRWTGGPSSWSVMSSPTSNDLFALSMPAADFGFGVGLAGTIVGWDGSSWTLQTSPTGNALRDVYLLDSTFGFAVGDMGTIIRWNGTNWSAAGSPVSSRLNGVHCLSTSSCWAVGDGGIILRWNGTSWTSATSPVVSRLNAIESRSESEGWAIGDFGVILTYDGISWTSVTSPTTWNLYGLTVQAPTDGWIGGAYGILLKDPPPVYQKDGTFLSTVLDTGSATTTYLTAYWDTVLPVATTAAVDIRTGNVSVPDPTWSSFSPLASGTGSPITAPSARYAQYRVTLHTDSVAVTPQFQDITVTFR